MFIRDYYLSQIEPFYDSIIIKLLLGVRGSGKSTIFHQIISDLKAKRLADDSHIILINFDYVENEKYKDKDALEMFIRKKIVDKQNYYVFLDEIQNVSQFELVLKSLSSDIVNISLFVSCSTSRFLVENLNSAIHGRYKEFYITPFSYAETCMVLNTTPRSKKVLLNYLQYGGLPERFKYNRSSDVKKYLYLLTDSIFLRDIVSRLGVTDIDDIIQIIKVLAVNIGKEMSPALILEKLEENNYEIPKDRFYTDIDALNKTLLVRPAYGYNVKCERVLYGATRYYFGDMGVPCLYGFDTVNNISAALKNLVWIEMTKKGYKLYSGINGDKTFDFVAVRKAHILYIQVEERFEDRSAINKIAEVFEDIEACHPRYLLSLDVETYAHKGLIHKNIFEFLLETIPDIDIDDEFLDWEYIE